MLETMIEDAEAVEAFQARIERLAASYNTNRVDDAMAPLLIALRTFREATMDAAIEMLISRDQAAS